MCSPTFLVSIHSLLTSADYLRVVIENGILFGSEHFFMMLEQLNAKFVEPTLASYLRILVQEFSISEFELTE
jgi:hypothetical protein